MNENEKGLVYQDAYGVIEFFKFHEPVPGLLDVLPRVDYPISLCSSSLGLVLFLDNGCRFVICNPKISLNDPSDGYRKIPRSPNPPIIPSPAVISLDISNYPAHAVYYISNPIMIRPNTYRIDTLSSEKNWELTGEHNVSGVINPKTAVSCGRMAYWLTTNGSLIAYDPLQMTFKQAPSSLPDLRGYDRWDAQLGVLRGDCLACVIVTEDNVNLFQLSTDHTRWETGLCSLGVEPDDDDNDEEWNGVGDYTEDDIDIICTNLPSPVRFETTRILEIPIIIDGKLFMWENDGNDIEKTRLRRMDDYVVPVAYVETAVTISRSDLQI